MHSETVRACLPPVAATQTEVRRPWGSFQTHAFLPGLGSMKILTIEGGKRLSLQRHKHRLEHWVVLRGSVVAEIDNSVHMLHEGQHIAVPLGHWHRLANASPHSVALVAEVQFGSSVTEEEAEEDIQRSEDDFGRM